MTDPSSPGAASKGKKRDSQRVSFAPSINTHVTRGSSSEREPLLTKSPTAIGQADEEQEEDEANEAQDTVGSLPSRLYRKTKKGLMVGGGKIRKAGAFPIYTGNGDDAHEGEITTQRALLYCVLALVAVAALLGAVVLVQSDGDHPTGPYPRPPVQTSSSVLYTKTSRPSSTTSDQEPIPSTTEPSIPFPLPPFPSGLPRNPAYLAKGKHGGVATENDKCSDIGIDMLKAGGSAVDAAIASTLCIGTLNMFSSGIGGGGFMTVRVPPSTAKHAKSSVWAIDFRETVPAAGNITMFNKDMMKMLFGGLSAGVPGELKGLAEAHKRWGRLPWKTLVLPSAKLASGWIVQKELDRRLHWMGLFMPDLPDWASVFAPNGTLLVEGDMVRRTTYAETLHTIANEGISAFYSRHSPIAQAFIAKVQKEGGIMTLDDLEDYEVRVTRALEGTYRGRKVYTTHAPTSGPVLLHMLNLLENYDLGRKEDLEVNLHRIVEAMKFGFAARTRIGDPVTKADAQRMSDIHTKQYAETILPKMTDDITHPPEYYNPEFATPTDHGTTHISVIDKDGMAVSLTSTVNLIFGSRVMDPVTGIIVNDELADFSMPDAANAFGLWPSPYNFPAAGKRPLSSIAPTIIEHPSGKVYMSLGGSGGSRIYGSVLQVILNHMDMGMDISEAVEDPRVHDQLYPLTTSVETTFREEGLQGLRDRGHNVSTFDINMGVAEVQAVVVEEHNGRVSAASDSRKHGIAKAY
ncbi:hypothetical protein FRB94_011144 [Tulasnella sp. JGI-2019a]|nr:hypothetical protein FRB93_000483 [Tulasnella sp. JGI-2019a]KAG9010008.1 hypothetical protein FRB94_011144 [Tulasnella sp. JGI-2019a]